MNDIFIGFLITVSIVLFICLLKFLFYNCVILRHGDDSTPILPGRREAFWIEYDRLRMQALWARQPPPDFDDALRNSRPVSYLEVEEEPPPTYDDFLKSCSPSPNSTLESPISQGVDYSQPVEIGEEVAIGGENFALNSFDNDFVIDLQSSLNNADVDVDSDAVELVDGVFRNRLSLGNNFKSENNQSEA